MADRFRTRKTTLNIEDFSCVIIGINYLSQVSLKTHKKKKKKITKGRKEEEQIILTSNK